MSPEAWSPEVGLGQAVFVLSDALDLVGVDDVLHGKRVAWLADHLLARLGEKALRADVRLASLVHDCGVSSTRHHQQLVVATAAHDDAHSEVGARLLADFPPLAHLAPAVRYHHAPWPRLADVGRRDKTLANAIFLADRIDVLQARTAPLDAPALRRAVTAHLLQPYGTLFSPELVEAAREALETSMPVDVLRGRYPELLAHAPEGPSQLLSASDALGLARLFAQAVDAKSPFTARHSDGVAAVALHLADASGRLRSSRAALEIAGLLHDLGKLRVPDAILEKPGALDPGELEVMRTHASESQLILARIGGFEDIARMAGQHHELLDGSGYPSGLRGDQVPFEAQLLAVADIFQALAQDRPYRRALPTGQILDILRGMVKAGRLDAGLVRLLELDVDHAWRLARPDAQACTAG